MSVVTVNKCVHAFLVYHGETLLALIKGKNPLSITLFGIVACALVLFTFLERAAIIIKGSVFNTYFSITF